MKLSWNKLDLTIRFRELGIAGSLPAAEVAERYSELVSAGASNEITKQLEQEGHVTKETIAAYLKNCTSVISLDEGGFHLRPVQVIGMLCMAGSRTKLTTMRKGMRATLIQGTTIVEPSKIHLKGGQLTTESRGMSPNGRPLIKRTQVLAGMDPVDFSIRWLANGDISCAEMKALLTVGQEIGLGGDRRFGYGKFDILKMVKVNGKTPCTEIKEVKEHK